MSYAQKRCIENNVSVKSAARIIRIVLAGANFTSRSAARTGVPKLLAIVITECHNRVLWKGPFLDCVIPDMLQGRIAGSLGKPAKIFNCPARRRGILSAELIPV